MIKKLPLLLVFLFVLAIFLSSSPPAFAEEKRIDGLRKILSPFTLPNSLTFCVKNSGTIYVVGQGFKKADCKNNDKLLDWNFGTTGPQGPKGDTGPQGPSGNDGTNGIDGINGINGTNGTNGTDGKDGAQGAQGVQGNPGIDGTSGASTGGFSGWQKITDSLTSTESAKTVTVTCPGIKKILSGGHNAVNNSGESRLYYNQSNYAPADNQWTSSVFKSGSTNWTLNVYAICASVL